MKKIALVLILLAVLIFNALRFWKLDTIPYGYHVDETASAVTVQCYAQRGCDAELHPWPLFGFMEYGQPKPPTYIYPGILWAKVFGATVPSLRAYSVFWVLIGITGLFFLGWELFGLSFGLVLALAATCSPWIWVMTRVALESFPTVVFAIWGLYFFWRSNSWWNWTLAGFFFAAAMYAYPPARMQIPLMMITLAVFEWGRRPWRFSSIGSLAGAFILLMIPLALNYVQGNLAARFDLISIFNKDYLASLGKAGTMSDIITIFVHNYLLHLSPDFLFFRGDPSYVHSTRHMGILSFLDTGALIIFLVFLAMSFPRKRVVLTDTRRSSESSLTNIDNPVIKHRRFLIFLAVNFFIGIIPSALTNQELPHALRICGSWYFMMLFTGLMWWSAAQFFIGLWPVIALVGILSSGVLAWQYFTLYPQQSKGMFDYWIMDAANQISTPQDWQQFLLTFHQRNYQCRYFMVNRLGMTCKQANDTWWQLFHQLKDRGLW